MEEFEGQAFPVFGQAGARHPTTGRQAQSAEAEDDGLPGAAGGGGVDMPSPALPRTSRRSARTARMKCSCEWVKVLVERERLSNQCVR